MMTSLSAVLVASAPPVGADRKLSQDDSSQREKRSPRRMPNLGSLPAAACNAEPNLNNKLERKETIFGSRAASTFAHLTPQGYDGIFISVRETQTPENHRGSGSSHGSAPHSSAFPCGGHDLRGADRLAHSWWFAADKVRSTEPAHLGGYPVTSMTNTNNRSTASAIVSPDTQDACGLAGHLHHPNAPTPSASAQHRRGEREDREGGEGPARADVADRITIWREKEVAASTRVRSSTNPQSNVSTLRMDCRHRPQGITSESSCPTPSPCLASPARHRRAGDERQAGGGRGQGGLRNQVSVWSSSQHRGRFIHHESSSERHHQRLHPLEPRLLHRQFARGLAGPLVCLNAPFFSTFAPHRQQARNPREGRPAPASAGAFSS